MSRITSVSIAILVLLATSIGGCLTGGPKKQVAAAGMPRLPPGTTRARMDPAHLPHVGGQYYPRDSLIFREQGRCDVSVTVEPDGSISERHVVASTTHSARLDRACRAAFGSDVRMLLATKDFLAVQETIVVPVVWCLIPTAPMADGTACNAPPPTP